MTGSGHAAKRLLRLSFLTALCWAVPQFASATLVGPGDIAFVRFNAEGNDDDFAIVLLADADAGQQVFFNDNEYNSTFNAFGNGEDAFSWNITENLAAGTVVTFGNLSDPSGAGAVSHGSITGDATNTMQLGESGETIYAYFGTTVSKPTTFLGAVSTEGSSVLNGTGLVAGDTAIVLPDGIDEAHYVGARNTEMSFPDYRTLIGSLNPNWVVRLTDTGMIEPAFDTTNFTLDGGMATPESPSMILLVMAGLSAGLWSTRWRRPSMAR